MNFQLWASIRSAGQEQKRGSQQHLLCLGTAPQHTDSGEGIFSGVLRTWHLCQEESVGPQRNAKSRSLPSGCCGFGAGLQ